MMRRYVPRTSLSDDEREPFDFVGSINGPFMRAYNDLIMRFFRRYNALHQENPIRGGCRLIGHSDEKYLDISLIRDPSKLPNIITGTGFGEYFGRNFLQRFVKTGYFQPIPIGNTSGIFKKLPLHDMTGSFNLYGGCSFVMLVDKRKLGGAPVPHRWEDLLSSCYHKKTVMGFHIDDVNESLLCYYHHRFGASGLRAFVENLCEPEPNLDMMRFSIPGENTHAVFILPYFFAGAAPKEDYLTVVWPDEGSIFSPCYILAHDIESEKSRAIISFLYSEEMAQLFRDRLHQHINPNVDYGLPSGASYDWLGWEYGTEMDITGRVEMIDKIAIPILLREYPHLAAQVGTGLWNG